ncbi:MAG: AAA family ATPase [Cyanobacteria bacterium P01_D01_bin.1]
MSHIKVLNPFQYGNPIQHLRSNLFKGRQALAENIVHILLNHEQHAAFVNGPRRCGKTSFLYNLPRLLPSQWIPIFVDAQSSAATTDESGFCQSLVRAIIRDGRSQGIQFPAIPDRSEFLAAPYITLEDWLSRALDDLAAKDPEKRLLLTIDEFEKIGSAMDEGKLTVALFDELRSLIQHWDQLGFVFCGVQTLDELGPNWSSYFISVVPVEMLYLQPTEARELLTDPDPEFSLTYAPGLIDEILQLTQCHPNLLQLIGAALVTEANERHTTTATADMLQTAIPRAFTLGTACFTNVWTEFTGDPRNSDEVKTGQTILKALRVGIQPDANADDLTKQALRRMERYHVLNVVDGQYTFDIPLIQRWVSERAILE